MSYDTRIRYGANWYGNTATLRVFRVDTDEAPARDIQMIDIPGKSGSLIIDNNKYRNVDMVYDFVFLSSIETMVKTVKNALLTATGYNRFLDNNYPDDTYLATVKEDLDPVFTPDRALAKMRVTFNRKPQRFLTSGQTAQTFTNSGSGSSVYQLTNPGSQPSQPLLKIFGTGPVTINGQTIYISAADEYTMVDCESMECYKDSVSKNGNVTLTNNKFPTLAVGSNSISLNAGITKVEITPRWWRL